MGALLVYSVTNRSSFENCETWLDELVHHADPGIIVMLVGNKTDLADQRDVSTEEGLEFSKKNNLHFIETSAKDNSNVSEAFERLIHEICRQHVNEPQLGGEEDLPAAPTGGSAIVDLHKDTPAKKDGDTCEC
eukprot:TRINITY_DN2974_c0_g3_i1.p1 TRINITY_DN2974_c0_g3~~TRINITY_DN2974_c0_g3_i1.p1  ORF type:complete len:133 (-),score=33.40 TRINITY_DN2974_c0_g3_i1:53-451(-)